MAHTLHSIIEDSVEKYSDMPAVRWIVKKETCEKTYAELDSDRKKIWHALSAKGLVGVHLAIIGTASYEWIATYSGITSGKSTAVPLDPALPLPELIDLLNRSDSKALFIMPKMEGYIPAIREACEQIECFIVLNQNTEPYDNADTVSFAQFIDGVSDEVVSSEESAVDDDICTIIYTSGTTGKSKGVMLSQQNLYDNVKNVVVTVEPGVKMLSVLPIHHAYCLTMDWMMGFSKGATLCINDSLLHMVKNIGKFQPEIMLMVPLMIETIYKRLKAAGDDVDKLAVGKSVFGENLRTIYSGGAHLDPFYIKEMEQYGIEICEGYGMSECSPTISTNGELGNKPGSVGLPLGNLEVRIGEGEEVQVRGTSVMQGYYKMPKETEEALKDGWLHTGDIGRIDEDGFLYITGRLKNLIIASNGENISPEELEGKIALSPLVGEVVVSGEDNGLCARIFPDPDVVEARGLSEEAVAEELQKVIDEFNKTQPTYRAIVSLVVRKYPFIKSSTKKIKRPLAHLDQEEE